jgi:hypothetical protein
MDHTSIYERLTADPDDLVGVLAYIAYKQQKIEYCRSFNGREPNREELESFHAIAVLDHSIEAYRAQGAGMARVFVSAGVDQFIGAIEVSVRQDVLYQQAETVSTGLLDKLTVIDNALAAKRSFIGWVRDVGGNLLVNLVSIFVLGALLLGYNFSAELQQGTEKKVSLERK